MRTLSTTKILLVTALIASGAAGFAQTSGTAGSTTSPGTGSTSGTATTLLSSGVGVTPQTANEANRQAVPRSDTGTVVRTSPNAVDSTRNATGM